jgi:purine-binding chemotaxis protein CheW
MLLFGFSCDQQRFALPLEAVDRVLPAVALTPLPGVPDIVLGALNLRGEVVPVVDFRRRAGLPSRPIEPSQFYLLANMARLRLALAVDQPGDVFEEPERLVSLQPEVATAAYVSGIIVLPSGITVVCDLDRFLSLNEEAQLQDALAQDSHDG